MQVLGISPTTFASLVSAYNFAGAFTGLIISLFADKFEKKILLSGALIGVSFGTIFCGLSNDGNQLFLQGLLLVFGGVLNPLVFALVAEWIPYKRRGKAVAWVMSGFSLASVIGVPLGLVINDYSPPHDFYFIGVAIFFSSIACYFGLPKASIPQKK